MIYGLPRLSFCFRLRGSFYMGKSASPSSDEALLALIDMKRNQHVLFTLFQQLLPFLIHILLGVFDHPLVSWTEHMLEPALFCQKFFYWLLFLWFVSQPPLSILDLIQGPYAGVHGQLADFRQIFRFVSPSSWTR